MSFDIQTIETIQQLVYPLVKTFTKFDPAAFVGSQAELFTLVGDALGDMGALFVVAGQALQDGILSKEEIEQIIAGAKSVDEAIDAITGHFKDEETE